MKIVIQRVKQASVTVDGSIVGSIDQGLLLLIGFGRGDDEELQAAQLQKISDKILKLRCFSDEDGKMNRSVLQASGQILAVSQFTLLGNLRKGNRPSFGPALEPESANRMFEQFCDYLSQEVNVEKGVFGADMEVSLINDGPVTFNLDSDEILGPRS